MVICLLLSIRETCILQYFHMNKWICRPELHITNRSFFHSISSLFCHLIIDYLRHFWGKAKCWIVNFLHNVFILYLKMLNWELRPPWAQSWAKVWNGEEKQDVIQQVRGNSQCWDGKVRCVSEMMPSLTKWKSLNQSWPRFGHLKGEPSMNSTKKHPALKAEVLTSHVSFHKSRDIMAMYHFG